MRVLVTGAAGFIGSHFIRYFIRKYPTWEFFPIDSINYARSLDRLADLRDRLKVFFHDLRAPFTDYLIRNLGELDYVFHLAAETHVDKSLVDPLPFLQSNVHGTFNLLEYPYAATKAAAEDLCCVWEHSHRSMPSLSVS